MRRVTWMGVMAVVALLGGCGDDDTLPRTTTREPSATTSVGAERIEYQPGVYLSLVDRDGCDGARPAMVTLDATIADDFAARGYLGMVVEARDPGHGSQFDTQMLRSIRSVVHDLGIAVQWLRAHAGEHCVAPDAIAATGYSFGALTALALAYSEGEEPAASISIDEFGSTVPVENDELDPVPADLVGYSNDVDGVVAFAGFALPEHLDAGEPPMILFHGRDDGVIPFSLAEATCAAARSVDVECELVPLAAEHGIDVHAPALLDFAERFLAREMLTPAGLGAG